MVFVKVPDEICRPFTFDDLESFPQNFALIGIGSKFEYFGLGNGESLKSQYHSYLRHSCSKVWLSL